MNILDNITKLGYCKSNVQYLNDTFMKKNDETLKILREINKNPNVSQRNLASKFNFSLGKLNYCLNALKKKGLLKINNFKKNKNRFNPQSKNNYLYILTPKGMAHKTKLAISFLKRKSIEYNEIKQELKKENNKNL